MIIKDKSIYLDYTKDIATKVNALCAKIPTEQSTHRQDIEKIRAKISAKILLITELANQKVGLIPNSDWMQYKKEIDSLYNQLSTKVKQALAHPVSHEIVR